MLVFPGHNGSFPCGHRPARWSGFRHGRRYKYGCSPVSAVKVHYTCILWFLQWLFCYCPQEAFPFLPWMQWCAVPAGSGLLIPDFIRVNISPFQFAFGKGLTLFQANHRYNVYRFLSHSKTGSITQKCHCKIIFSGLMNFDFGADFLYKPLKTSRIGFMPKDQNRQKQVIMHKFTFLTHTPTFSCPCVRF